MAVWDEQESGFLFTYSFGEHQDIEGWELSGLMMISWHAFLVRNYPGVGLASEIRKMVGAIERWGIS